MHKIVVSVKGGGIKLDDVREREKAEIALFISRTTAAMVKDVTSVGFYESVAGKKFARLQLNV